MYRLTIKKTSAERMRKSMGTRFLKPIESPTREQTYSAVHSFGKLSTISGTVMRKYC
jgi:hypothetical protein